MHPNQEFVTALTTKKKVMLTFRSRKAGTILFRTCAPMDFGPSYRTKDRLYRYRFWDFDSDQKHRVLSLLPNEIVSIEPLDESFDPAEFVTWPTISWFLPRDWGQYS